MGRTVGWMVAGLLAGWTASAQVPGSDLPAEASLILLEACTQDRKSPIDPTDTEAVIACVMKLLSTAQVSDDAGLYVQAPIDYLADRVFDIELGGMGEIFAGQDLDIYSDGDVFIDLDDDNDGSNYFRVVNGGDETACTIYENGDLDCAGTKSAVVQTESYGERKLYAIEGTESWFEDIGTARLDAGSAEVRIDPIYAETVNLQAYQVFLTPVGAWANLYLAEQTGTWFRVARADPGPDVAFHYRIVARRRGFEDLRLEEGTVAGASSARDR